MYNPDTVARILKTKRAEKGVNQEQLAEVLNVTRNTIGRWETGESVVPSDKALELADFFGCSVDELIGRAPKEA